MDNFSMNTIKGKRILILGGHSWDFYKIVNETILRMGAKSVEWHQPALVRGSLRNPITTDTFFDLVKYPNDRKKKNDELIKEFKEKRYDVVLFWSNSAYGKTFLDFLRHKNPGVKIYLFLWDTLKDTFPRYTDYFPKFDRVYTFDRDDALKYEFSYLPNPIFDLSPPPMKQI